ncbi:recombinase family protein [Paenibacillus sp. FSL H7-0323]|uniref:recombinase family protein n=1 Tax=Paenibacillus sp. FSL H7-0323 TaxID=2921433 RepID=UPI0030FAC12E
MKVAAYIRVSTDEQVEKGNSLTEQSERLESYCKAMGWNKPDIFSDDGISAKNINRPSLKKLIARVEQNEFDIVLTTKLDRLCRNLLDLLQLVNLFQKHNCEYASSSESFDTSTAVGRMTLQLLGTFAEFERERTSERVKDNMISLAKNTNKALGKPCYGYIIEDGLYAINEEEAKNVSFMFDLAEEGHGHRMIAKRLNDAGVTTRKEKMWDQVNVRKLMANETLSGVMIYNKRATKNGKTIMRDASEWIINENNHPAIIEPERFEKVRMIFKARSISRKHADNESYILTGLVKCKHCEANMKGNTQRIKRGSNDYAYYRYMCSSYTLGYGCKHHAVHREDLESLIIEEVKKLASLSEKELNINIAAAVTDEEEIKEIMTQLARIEKKIQKQIEAYENDLISANDLKAASQRVEIERGMLRIQLEKLKDKKGDASAVKSNAERLLGDITGVDRLKAKKALALIIDKIEVEDGEIVDITWKNARLNV